MRIAVFGAAALAIVAILLLFPTPRPTISMAVGIYVATALAIAAVLPLIPARTPAIEGANAIASLEAVQLGGVKQWLLIRSRDRSNPVLLCLHGGPGFAWMPLARKFSSRLEEHFVVVHWDQRGAGKSSTSQVSDDSLHLEQYLADTVELVELLRRRFGVPKIYLLGHSWGTVLGTLTVQRYPKLFHAYVGLGQVVNMSRGEEISYRFVLEHAQADGNQRALGQLEGLRRPYQTAKEVMTQRKWLGHYRGDFKTGNGFFKILRALLFCPEYRIRDKVNFIRAMMNSLDHAWTGFQHLDFIQTVPRLEVPVYFFTGRHDYCVPFELVEEWTNVLEAPHVANVWFENSAHNACLEEPDRFQRELIDRVLEATH